jgi:23S rRNA pseudouridine2605 synthase
MFSLRNVGMFHRAEPSFFFRIAPSRRFSSETASTISLSKILSQNTALSRRELERLIKSGDVTVKGEVVKSNIPIADWKDIQKSSAAVKVLGKPVQIKNAKKREREIPRVWCAHKLSGELVTEKDPQGRPSIVDRLTRGGVGKKHKDHLKPIGRLDIPTEGLILITNDGNFAREMELPSNQIHRVYRARVHGRLNSYKLDRIRQGFDSYKAMKVSVERRHRRTKLSANTWLQITTSEGQVRL